MFWGCLRLSQQGKEGIINAARSLTKMKSTIDSGDEGFLQMPVRLVMTLSRIQTYSLNSTKGNYIPLKNYENTLHIL